MWIERQLLKDSLTFAHWAAHIKAKIHFNVIRAWSEIMSLKSDQLEILLSVYWKHVVKAELSKLTYVEV